MAEAQTSCVTHNYCNARLVQSEKEKQGLATSYYNQNYNATARLAKIISNVVFIEARWH